MFVAALEFPSKVSHFKTLGFPILMRLSELTTSIIPVMAFLLLLLHKTPDFGFSLRSPMGLSLVSFCPSPSPFYSCHGIVKVDVDSEGETRIYRKPGRLGRGPWVGMKVVGRRGQIKAGMEEAHPSPPTHSQCRVCAESWLFIPALCPSDQS